MMFLLTVGKDKKDLIIKMSELFSTNRSVSFFINRDKRMTFR